MPVARYHHRSSDFPLHQPNRSIRQEVYVHFTKPVLAAILFLCLGLSVFGQCVHVGGGIITNVGVISADRTLGTATGDLGGAIGVQIISQSPGPGGTTVLTVHHFWVTESGDTIFVDPAQLTAKLVAPNLFAVVTYPLSISGGTGKFKGATGKLKAIGEVDFNDGQVGLRYSGRVCFATSDDDKDAAAVTHSDAGVATNVAVPAEHPRSVSSVMLARERRLAIPAAAK
ncbi:MAG TPA: hypothetical protein VN952_04440 [Chthoniobacterales bacterium]|nr:hypothetical protein [Chthoniobacterales bacterium]